MLEKYKKVGLRLSTSGRVIENIFQLAVHSQKYQNTQKPNKIIFIYKNNSPVVSSFSHILPFSTSLMRLWLSNHVNI